MLLMLLAFTSQIMAAAAMTCELEKVFIPVSNITHQNHTKNHMDHSAHEMHKVHDALDHGLIEHGAVDDSINDSGDQHPTTHHQSFCCTTMAHCLLGCTLIAVSNSFLLHLEVTNSGVEDFYSSTASNPFIPSLYRPPILS